MEKGGRPSLEGVVFCFLCIKKILFNARVYMVSIVHVLKGVLHLTVPIGTAKCFYTIKGNGTLECFLTPNGAKTLGGVKTP